MKANRLIELPLAPEGRTGWPWTRSVGEGLAGLRQMSKFSEHSPSWPRVSVVTPSYNQAEYLEETIRSVLMQEYPDLEYIVVDGGSTDGSIEIIRRYEPWLSWWVSEPDRGQGHAINKGFSRATGEILGWLNSDDLLTEAAVLRAVQALLAHQEADVVYSDFDELDEGTGKIVRRRVRPAGLASLLADGNCIPQPTAFFRRAPLERIGPISEELYHALDWDLWLRVARHGRLHHLAGVSLAVLRDQPQAKTRAARATRPAEFFSLLDRVYADPALPTSAQRARRAAYARVYWLAAEAATAEGRGFPDGLRWLRRSLATHLRPTARRPLMTLRLLKTISFSAAKGLSAKGGR